MRILISVSIYLVTAISLFGQDQLKTKNSNKVLQVKIKDINETRIKFLTQTQEEKNLFTDDLDSIFTTNERIIQSSKSIKSLIGRISATPLLDTLKEPIASNQTPKIKNIESELSLAQVFKELKSTQFEVRNIKESLAESGNTLSLAGALILSGIGSGVVGGYLLAIEKTNVGIGFTIAGGLLGLVGYGAIIHSGNLLNRTIGKDAFLGLGSDGVGVQYKF